MKKIGKQILMLSLALLSPVIFIVLIISMFVLFANIKYWRIDRGILNKQEIVSILSTKVNPNIEINYIWVRLKLKDGSTVVLGDVDLEKGEVVFSSLDKFNDSGILRKFYYDKSNEMFSMSGLNYYSIYNTKEQIYRGKNAQIKNKK